MNQTGSLLVLSTAYFPPVNYFSEILKHTSVMVEAHENYLKQSYRNRCYILGANGPLALTIPVKEGSLHKVAISELQIDNSRKWQNNHARALKAAYGSSAFWEYVMDEINLFFTGRFDSLSDFNMEILVKLLDYLEIDIPIEYTSSFSPLYDESVDDLRYSMHPKQKQAPVKTAFPSYFQVFGPGKPFIPNLSILDLLFNMGPESYSYLMGIKKEAPL